ncbi:hypothetical protein FC38_GL001068 [Lactobacillus gigeriorum DSM 23908 = CRBIP 24.85]|uniref:S-layer protein C-terminal domain-containing protein n=2 Tax=Lactobacillus gigeriorum DSM 23908 = CRBIP 24.85 TaxID=1423751 RepID=A0ABR5PWX1_9LACO|nr:hypothetical protein FC38_GL001068 [Lactobacillus gigeriorum DSM 23908 = CRBIP 24.85]
MAHMNRWLIKILTLIGCLLMLPSTLVTASPKNKTKAPKIVVETDPVEIIKTDAKQSYVRLIKAVKPYRANSGVRIYYVKITDQGLLYGTKKKQWLPASSTTGTVWYQEDGKINMVVFTDSKGKITYQLYDPVASATVELIHNAYLYDRQGQLILNRKGNLVKLLKGKKLTVYTKQQIHGKPYYLLKEGWIKVSNTKILKNI